MIVCTSGEILPLFAKLFLYSVGRRLQRPQPNLTQLRRDLRSEDFAQYAQKSAKKIRI